MGERGRSVVSSLLIHCNSHSLSLASHREFSLTSLDGTERSWREMRATTAEMKYFCRNEFNALFSIKSPPHQIPPSNQILLVHTT